MQRKVTFTAPQASTQNAPTHTTTFKISQLSTVEINSRIELLLFISRSFGLSEKSLMYAIPEYSYRPYLGGVEVASALIRRFRAIRKLGDLEFSTLMRDLTTLCSLLGRAEHADEFTVSLVPDIAQCWRHDVETLLESISNLGGYSLVKELLEDMLRSAAGGRDLEHASFAEVFFGISLIEQALKPVPGSERGLLHLLSEPFRSVAATQRVRILSIVSDAKIACESLA